MSDDELRDAHLRGVGLVERIEAELEYWGDLCQRFSDLQEEMTERRGIFDDLLKSWREVNARLRELLNDDDDWWKQ